MKPLTVLTLYPYSIIESRRSELTGRHRGHPADEGRFVQAVSDGDPAARFLAQPRRLDDDVVRLGVQRLVQLQLERLVGILSLVHLPDHVHRRRFELAVELRNDGR